MNGIDPQMAATRLIEQLNSMRDSAAGARVEQTAAVQSDFGALIKHYINQVNDTQQQAKAAAADFESGIGNVQLLDVMVSMQKSRIAFEALTQVRNRFLSAYQEIMNMQV